MTATRRACLALGLYPALAAAVLGGVTFVSANSTFIMMLTILALLSPPAITVKMTEGIALKGRVATIIGSFVSTLVLIAAMGGIFVLMLGDLGPPNDQ